MEGGGKRGRNENREGERKVGTGNANPEGHNSGVSGASSKGLGKDSPKQGGGIPSGINPQGQGPATHTLGSQPPAKQPAEVWAQPAPLQTRADTDFRPAATMIPPDLTYL